MLPKQSRDFRRINTRKGNLEWKSPDLPKNKSSPSWESGRKTGVAARWEYGASEATIYKWKQKYGGLEVNEAKRLREFEQENSKLKRMVANLMLEKEANEEALKSCKALYLSMLDEYLTRPNSVSAEKLYVSWACAIPAFQREWDFSKTAERIGFPVYRL